MANHRKDRAVVDRSAEERQDRFNRELLGETRLKELREKHVAGRLSAAESLELVMQGNSEHVAALKSAPMTPHQRYLKIMAGQADYMIVRCSDSRIHQTDSEQDNLVGIHIYIAGNVIPGKKTASFDEIAQVASLVRSDGVCLDEAHCNCGAVKERVKWVEGGMKPTGSESLDMLLHEVMGPTPLENAHAQLSKLRHLPALGERATGALYYDWEGKGVSVVDANSSPTIELLVDMFNKRHADANADGHLAERNVAQKPHVTVIASNLLPFSVPSSIRARSGEAFATTGSGNGLDEFDEGSVLYSIEHLGVRHICMIAPGVGANSEIVSAMFDQWEADLRAMTVNGKPVLANMIDSGELVISRLRYDLTSGRLMPAGEPKIQG